MKNFWKKIKKPITVLAPMDDVTDFVFREMMVDLGKPDVMYTEFTSADSIFSNGRTKALEGLKFSDDERPVVGQIWGANPENMGKSSALLCELGFDGIDINMGCPDKSVFSANAGSALIGNFELSQKIIESVVNNSGGLPVSIKTRLAGTKEKSDEWLSFLLKQDIKCLILHARTRKQMYGGSADWDYIKYAVDIKNTVSPETIFIGNGDVKNYAEIIDKSQKYGVDGVMVGRGILHSPYLFRKDDAEKFPTVSEGLLLLEKHLGLYKKTWGDRKNIANLKKFVKAYIHNFRGADAVRHSLMLCKNYEEFKAAVEQAKDQAYHN